MMLTAVCICTYRRRSQLGRLLRSLDAQTFSGRIVIIVVDNDSDPSGLDVIELQTLTTHDVHLVHQPDPGIPQARNKSVDHALALGATHIAFVDDDEVVHRDWLSVLHDVQAREQADVVTGPVIPDFPSRSSAWLAGSGVFGGARMPTGTERTYAATNNTLALADCFADGLRFDPELRFVGGEDADLFAKLHSRGRRIVWADEAEVREPVPPERATLRWVLLRSYRVGGDVARRHRQRQARSTRVKAALGMLAGIPQLLLLPLDLIRDGRVGVASRLSKAAKSVGFAACMVSGRQYQEYARRSNDHHA